MDGAIRSKSDVVLMIC